MGEDKVKKVFFLAFEARVCQLFLTKKSPIGTPTRRRKRKTPPDKAQGTNAAQAPAAEETGGEACPSAEATPKAKLF